MNGGGTKVDTFVIDQDLSVRMNGGQPVPVVRDTDSIVDTTFKIARAPPRKSHFPGVTICASCCQAGCSFAMESVGIQCAGCNGLYIENNAFTIVKVVGGIRQRGDPCRQCNPHLAIPASARIYCHDCMEEKRNRKRQQREEEQEYASREMKRMFL